MRKSYDVIIIGAGVMGSVSAYYLAKEGLRVLVLEKKDTCMGTGGATGGIVSWFTKQPGFHRDLFMKSYGLFDALEEELGTIGLDRHKGFMQLIETEMEWELTEQGFDHSAVPAGCSVHMLNRKEMLELEPHVGPDIMGALYVPESGHVHVFNYIYALVRGAKKLGVEFRTQTEVAEVVVEGGKAIGVKTAAGECIYGGVIINACGVWAPFITEKMGFHFPIKPRRGQIVALEPCAPFVHMPITNSMYQVIKFHPELITDERVKRLGYTFAIEQSEEGTIMLNNTREFAGYDTGVTMEAIQCIVEGAVKHFPGLRGMNIIRVFAGLRPYTPDGLPILGPVPGVENFLMAAGHEGDGIALSPITGKIMHDLVLEGSTDMDIRKLAASRFADGV